MDIQSIQDVTGYLHRLIAPPTTKPKKYTLETMRQLMAYLGNPQDSLKIIHVAGTSGKTSTSYFIASLLQQAGYRVGLTVSPHVDSIMERAQIDSTVLPESDFVDDFKQFAAAITAAPVTPSYFECLVAFAYWSFAKRKVDYAVVEVGLGGLLDGTNVVTGQHKVCVITDIGFDHTEILGDSIELITSQKAGIIQYRNKVFMNEQQPAVARVIQDVCHVKSASLTIAKSIQTSINLSLPAFQIRNFQLAYAVVSSISIKPLTTAQLQSAAAVYIPARMEETIYKNKIVILDGSHNKQKVAMLVQGLVERYPDKTMTLVISIGQNKQAYAVETLTELRKISDDIVLTEYTVGQDEPRLPIKNTVLADTANDLMYASVTLRNNPQDALDEALQHATDMVVVTGSFYLLNDIRPQIFKSGD